MVQSDALVQRRLIDGVLREFQHGGGAIDCGDVRLGNRSCKPDGHVRRSTAQIEHVRQLRGVTRDEMLHIPFVGVREIGSGVSHRFRVAIHDFRFENSVHRCGSGKGRR